MPHVLSAAADPISANAIFKHRSREGVGRQHLWLAAGVDRANSTEGLDRNGHAKTKMSAKLHPFVQENETITIREILQHLLQFATGSCIRKPTIRKMSKATTNIMPQAKLQNLQDGNRWESGKSTRTSFTSV